MCVTRSSVALLIICHDRHEELRRALAAAAADSFDEVVVLDMASEVPVSVPRGIHLVRSDVNVGVAEGRNRLARLTSCDVLVFLDDDAYLLAPVADYLRALFQSTPQLALAASLVRRQGGAIERAEFPFRGRPRDTERARDCAYFVGCAYAIRRDAWQDVGGYDKSFFYSTEELDLSFRLLASGWRLRYDPRFTVEHRPSASGRAVAPRVPALRARNRIILARVHLPLLVGVLHVSIWLVRTSLEAVRARAVRSWMEGVRDGFTTDCRRAPIPWKVLCVAHRAGGRALW